MAAVGTIVAAILAWRRRWLTFGTWLATVGGSAVLDDLLQGLFARPRPSFKYPLLVETSSFPSGHAMGSFVRYGMLAYLAVLALETWRARTAVVLGTRRSSCSPARTSAPLP